MAFLPERADLRFGCGLSPVQPPPESITAMLAGVSGADVAADRFPIERFDIFRARLAQMQVLRKIVKEKPGSAQAKTAEETRARMNRETRRDMISWGGMALMRRSHTPHGFHERLAFFWGDHFTAMGQGGPIGQSTGPYQEEAIRPHISGRFSDLLIAAVSHPLMLYYLNQNRSIGPDSNKARRKPKKSYGLNENLAREVLELHTLGVGADYAQKDVRALAELFTGMTATLETGFVFRPGLAQPGAETVLGKTYGADASMDNVRAVLVDLAAHPATARHIATKLAVHFVSDRPDPALVAHLEQAYLASNGALIEVYRALLEHPSAWRTDASNVKQPVDFIGSSLRALAVEPDRVVPLSQGKKKRYLMQPMELMGQLWEKPIGPDGWSEADGDWITPQGLAARIRWALLVPQILRPDLPVPDEFVSHALGENAPDVVRFAANAAETRADAVGIVLASPAFQRR